MSFPENHHFVYFSKTPPFSRPCLTMVHLSPTTHASPSAQLHKTYSTSFSLSKLKSFPKLAHRTEQFVPAVHIRGLGYSNSFTLCRGSTLFPHPSGNSSCQPRPAIQGVCEVEPPAIAFPLLMLVQDPSATNSSFTRHLVQDPPSRNLDVRTRSSIRRPKGGPSIPQSIRLPGAGFADQDAGCCGRSEQVEVTARCWRTKPPTRCWPCCLQSCPLTRVSAI